jgi:antagonist of KipI
VVEFKHFHHGFRVVMAIGGGIDTPEVLGRRGAHLFADLGPKIMKKGDFLSLKNRMQALNQPYLKKLYESPQDIRASKWSVASPYVSDAEVIDVFAMTGQQLHLLSKPEQEAFWKTIWTVSSQSNRMGIRLQGGFSITTSLSGISSQGLTFGSVQLPSSGKPIIMLCEHQTTGGYPKLAEVIESEQSKLAQLKPGQKIRFHPTQLVDADKMNIAFQEEIQARLKGIRIALEEKNS